MTQIPRADNGLQKGRREQLWGLQKPERALNTEGYLTGNGGKHRRWEVIK